MTESDPVSSTSNQETSPELAVSDSGGSTQFTVRFWGVRGSVPAPGPETVRYGGNTACIEVLLGEQRLVFDGGTGLRVLGKHLLRRNPPTQAHLFFTHTHWDRIQGFPFFLPAFEGGNSFHIYGAPAPNGASIKQRLTDQMLRPNFFTPLQQMQAQLEFHNIHEGSVIPLDDVLVETIGLNRHTSALGYRVSWQGHSLVYATDTDHSQQAVDPNLMYLAAGADVLILDGTYADGDYYDRHGEDIIPWENCLEVAKSADVKQLILFHHDPRHDDDYLDRLETKVQSHLPNAHLAYEGMVLNLI